MQNNGLNRSNNAKKIAFFTPYFCENRGNATTAKRLIHGLEEVGLTVEMFAYEEQPWTEKDQERVRQCDLIHILHFRRFADWKKKVNFTSNQPYLLTSGGTDVNHDIFNGSTASQMRALIEEAAAITTFSEDGKNKVLRIFSIHEESVHVIPQSVWLPQSSGVDNQTVINDLECYVQFPHVLLPAGLRPVKDVLYLLPALKQLRKQYPSLTFTILGAVLDQEVYEQVQEACRCHDWVHFIHDVSLETMATVYQKADLVVNSSLTEGQSTVILEAMAMKTPVLARRNAGNESIVTDGFNGFLFASLYEFTEKATSLLSSKQLEKQLVDKAKQIVLDKHDIKTEIRRYQQVYHFVCKKSILQN